MKVVIKVSTFSIRLKRERELMKEKNKKWTQEYVANKVGVARVTYTAYENGTKMPPFDTINSIADLFDVTTDFLMGRSDDPRLSEKEDKRIDKEANELLEILENMEEPRRSQMKKRILDYARGLSDADKD